MADAIYDALGNALTRWSMGTAAAPAMPIWQDELGDDPVEAELRLLALASQFLGGMVVASPAGALYSLPDIPPLTLPSVNSPLRPPVRRILARERDAAGRRQLLDFLAARGRTIHPADWMPSANDDDIPELYAPWRDWAAAAVTRTAVNARDDDALSAENWDEYWPATRQAALIALRKRDPAAARIVLEVKIGNEAAEMRLRLLTVLAMNLSDADRSFLDTLANGDRAAKVKALATSLLARLGHATTDGGEAAELAEFFEIQSKGLLRRTKTLAAKALKTPAQTQRRQALLTSTDAPAFAAALQLDLDSLIGMWRWGETPQADSAFTGMMERSGSNNAVVQLLDLLVGQDPPNVQCLLRLAPRLDSRQRDAAAVRLLRTGASFQLALSMAGGCGRIDGAMDFPAGLVLLDGLRPQGDDAKPADQSSELHALGLLATPETARGAIAKLNAIGILSADPRFDMVRLNAALDTDGAIA